MSQKNKAINKLVNSKKYVRDMYDRVFGLIQYVKGKEDVFLNAEVMKLEDDVVKVSQGLSLALDCANDIIGEAEEIIETSVTVRCLRCEEFFHTSDAKRNRICKHCKDLEKEFEYRQKNINTRFI